VPDAGDRLHLVRLDPGADELLPGVDLEAVRRLATLHARREHGLGVAARATGHRGVDDLHAWIFLLVDLEHLGEAVRLTAGGPPAEDLERARPAGRGARAGTGGQELGERASQDERAGGGAGGLDELTTGPLRAHSLSSEVGCPLARPPLTLLPPSSRAKATGRECAGRQVLLQFPV